MVAEVKECKQNKNKPSFPNNPFEKEILTVLVNVKSQFSFKYEVNRLPLV